MTKEKLSNHRIEVARLGSGWAAVHTVDVTDEKGTYRDIQQTGIGRYLTEAEAMLEASMWSKSDEIPLYTPGAEPEAAPTPAPGHHVIFTEEERKLLADYHRTSDMVEWRLDPEEQAELNRMSELWKGIQAKLEPTPAAADPETTVLYSARTPEDGVIRLVKWPEGYVLWHHGKIVWRSWEAPTAPVTAFHLTEWERLKLLTAATAAALTYFGHSVLGGLKPHENEEMKLWDALSDKLKDPPPLPKPEDRYVNKATRKWHRLVGEEGDLLKLERVDTGGIVYLGREQFELRFERWVVMPW